MAYNIVYVEDQATESREQDLSNLGFNVTSHNPSSDIREVVNILKETKALAVILDYRLTRGVNKAIYDAPTIAQTLRSKHSDERFEIPIVLMSNEDVITDYYDDFTSQDLFDFSLTKKQFGENKEKFKLKLNSFVKSYELIESHNFDLIKILGENENEKNLIHSRLIGKAELAGKNVYEISRLVYEKIIRSIGVLIGEDVLSARLGVSMDSPDWDVFKDIFQECRYKGIFSDIHSRWWMGKLSLWWEEEIGSQIPLKRLNADERVDILLKKYSGLDLIAIKKTSNSLSSSFWTICKVSNKAIDPFDGIELFKKDYLPWEEKEYLSIDSALIKLEDYKNFISEIDKKALREIAKNIRENG